MCFSCAKELLCGCVTTLQLIWTTTEEWENIQSGNPFVKTYYICRFFGSVNSILTCLTRPIEHVQIQLLYSDCVPRLIYGAAVKELSASEKQQLNVAVNNAVRRIFGFRR